MSTRSFTCYWSGVLLCAVLVHPADAGVTERVSVGSGGIQSNSNSFGSALSWDGRYVAFESIATNLVPGDTNGVGDVFVHDRLMVTTVRVSVDSHGAQANGYSVLVPSGISADGTRVALVSAATNLVPGDTNGQPDLFVHDLMTGETVRADVTSLGAQDPVGIYDAATTAFSGDGRVVAFASWSEQLVPGDANGKQDVFVHDLVTGETSLASVSSSGEQGNADCFFMALSGNGRLVAFDSPSSNLVPSSSNGYAQVYLHDLATGQTTLLSTNERGELANGASYVPSLSADGRTVAFVSDATNLTPEDRNGVQDAFVKDLATGRVVLASVDLNGQPFGVSSSPPRLSANGLSAAFAVYLGWLGSQPSMFVHEIATHRTSPVSVGADGHRAQRNRDFCAISGDGVWCTFASDDDALVQGDTNGRQDVFAHRQTLLAFDGIPKSPNPVHFTIAHGEPADLAVVMLSASGTDGFLLAMWRIPLTFDMTTLAGLQAFTLLSAVVDNEGTAVTPTLLFPEVAPGQSFYASAIIVDRITFEIESVAASVTVVTR